MANEPEVDLGENGAQDRGDGTDGQDGGRPPGQDAGPEQGDPEEEAAEQEDDAADLVEGLDPTDVAARRAPGGNRQDVVDVPRLRRGEGRQDGDSDGLHTQDGEISGGEQRVADQAESPGLPGLAQVHPGDADERQDGHQRLDGLAHRVVGGGHGRRVEVGVSDLDADEQQARGDGRQACRSGEESGGDGHVRLLFDAPWRGAGG